VTTREKKVKSPGETEEYVPHPGFFHAGSIIKSRKKKQEKRV
jgi:hypothetical protein